MTAIGSVVCSAQVGPPHYCGASIVILVSIFWEKRNLYAIIELLVFSPRVTVVGPYKRGGRLALAQSCGFNGHHKLQRVMMCSIIIVGSHRVPSPNSHVTWGQSMQSWLLRSWVLGLTTSQGTQVLGPKYDMNAYMATLSGGEAWNLCWELGRAKSKNPTLDQTSPCEFVCIEQSRSYFIEWLTMF